MPNNANDDKFMPAADDMPQDTELALRERVADLVAGDLDPDTTAQLQSLIKHDPQLAAEEQFWQRVRGVLPQAAHPPTVPLPGPGMAAVLRRRLSEEPAISPKVQPPRPAAAAPRQWTPWLVAAAALVAMLLFGLRQGDWSSSPGTMYDEYGAAVGSSQVATQRVSFTAPETAPETTPERAESRTTLVDHPEDRVWMGLWTQPIELEGFSRNRGLQVLRVADGGPAARAGLRPRDIILAVDSMATSTRWCVPAALKDAQPEQEITITYWRHGFAEAQQITMQLGRCWE